MVLIAIVACETGFWLAVLAGLGARYVLRRRRLGAALLIAAPVIDAVLLTLVTVDLLGGGTASWHHGLAALYIGISVAYGHRMIAWADARVAHLVDKVPLPPKLTGWAYTRACWRDVARTMLAAAIAGGILLALVWLVGDPERTSELDGLFPVLGFLVAIDALWAISYTIWPRRTPAEA
ncbi:hypothetical protein GCM10010988_01680 [Cnuibacter physcomitrellae]|uniref:Uncharacterized protein n=1 Tax=Cnuibacter physcomitrellae TaxID=1619308 RepID=A0A1X9LLE8_9MICO|nr:hypothetical protein [Cnuibacter physcomitrellae]ARJ05118.1 hypothetical protein B5808_07795 [Cnuibacter physcomitrellae]GGI34989.1 hypothetical protein GCM10010988_01680 [Cnuibacter physcomitrellae]